MLMRDYRVLVVAVGRQLVGEVEEEEEEEEVEEALRL
jgi:hypothetical protein